MTRDLELIATEKAKLLLEKEAEIAVDQVVIRRLEEHQLGLMASAKKALDRYEAAKKEFELHTMH